MATVKEGEREGGRDTDWMAVWLFFGPRYKIGTKTNNWLNGKRGDKVAQKRDEIRQQGRHRALSVHLGIRHGQWRFVISEVGLR